MGASSGVAFTCTPPRKKTSPARSVAGSNGSDLSRLFRIVRLEENIERLLLREKARDAGNDFLAFHFERRRRDLAREFPALASAPRMILRHRHKLARKQHGAERHARGRALRHDERLLERADFPGLIFAREEFQTVGAGRKHHAALIHQVAAIHLLKSSVRRDAR